MLDKVVSEKFHANVDDAAVRKSATHFVHIFQAAKAYDQTIVDILYASQVSRRTSPEGIAEIGFAMGMQFGFELAQSFPPLEEKR